MGFVPLYKREISLGPSSDSDQEMHGRRRYSTLAAPSSLLRFLVHLALVRSRRSSNPECETSSRTCGLRGGATLAVQGRAVHEEVHATALPASICTTPTRYRSSATARLVVIL